MCIFIQKRHMSFGKKPQLIKWFNLLLLKPTPPQKLLYKPRLFYSNHPFIATSNCGQHRQLGHQLDCHPLVHHHHPSGIQLSSNSTTTSRPKTLKKPEGIIEDIIAEVKNNDEDHLWKAVVTKEVLSPPPTLLEELARELDAPKQDGVTSLVNRDPFFIF